MRQRSPWGRLKVFFFTPSFPNPVTKQSRIPGPKQNCYGNPKSQGEMPQGGMILALKRQGRCRLDYVRNRYLGICLKILCTVTF